MIILLVLTLANSTHVDLHVTGDNTEASIEINQTIEGSSTAESHSILETEITTNDQTKTLKIENGEINTNTFNPAEVVISPSPTPSPSPSASPAHKPASIPTDKSFIKIIINFFVNLFD